MTFEGPMGIRVDLDIHRGPRLDIGQLVFLEIRRYPDVAWNKHHERLPNRQRIRLWQPSVA